MASAQAERKARLMLLTQIALKGRSSGVLVVTSQVLTLSDTIPNAVGHNFSTKILLSSAPAELVRMVFPTSSPGAFKALLVSLRALL